MIEPTAIDPAALQAAIGNPERTAVRTGSFGPVLELSTGGARAAVALQGAQLLSWQPAGHAEVIWVSPATRPAPGKPLRGGTPVCWPWFGPDPEGLGRPAHGFVRGATWHLDHTDVTEAATLAAFSHRQTAADGAQWPHAASVRVAFALAADSLSITLTTLNEGTTAFVLSEALHTYFAVADVSETTVLGLDGCAYIDKVGPEQRRRQTGPVAFTGEVDRIYLDPPGDIAIADAGNARTICIASRGSRSAVVWNPWIEKSARLGDMGAEGFRRMVCVETANAADDAVRLAPGGRHELSALYSVERSA